MLGAHQKGSTFVFFNFKCSSMLYLTNYSPMNAAFSKNKVIKTQNEIIIATGGCSTDIGEGMAECSACEQGDPEGLIRLSGMR